MYGMAVIRRWIRRWWLEIWLRVSYCCFEGVESATNMNELAGYEAELAMAGRYHSQPLPGAMLIELHSGRILELGVRVNRHNTRWIQVVVATTDRGRCF